MVFIPTLIKILSLWTKMSDCQTGIEPHYINTFRNPYCNTKRFSVQQMDQCHYQRPCRENVSHCNLISNIKTERKLKYIFISNKQKSTTQEMIKYTQNKIYLPLYSLTENNTCIVKLCRKSSFGMFHFSASVS